MKNTDKSTSVNDAVIALNWCIEWAASSEIYKNDNEDEFNRKYLKVRQALTQAQEKPSVDLNAVIEHLDGTIGVLYKEDIALVKAVIDHLAEQGYLGAPVVPEGFALVPIEPTDAMLIAGRSANVGPRSSVHGYIYKAMINAAKQV